MPSSRKAKRARRERRTSPPVNSSPVAEVQSVPSRWPLLAAWKRPPVLWGAALAAIVAGCSFPALSAGFVLDDVIFSESPAIRAWSGLWNIWFSPAELEGEKHYWPILYTTFWLEHKLWGITPLGAHLVNVLLYLVSVLLLWRLLRHLSVPGAWAVAAVFAVHPMHVDSVAWAIGRKDLLSGLFYIAAALCWIRSIGGLDESRGRPPDSIRVSRPGFYSAALGLFAAALLSKSVAVTLPVALAILLWWKRGRVTLGDGWRIAPFFVVALVISLADLAYYTSGREFPFDYSFPERTLIAGRALWYYVGKLVWPADLAVFGPLWDIDTADLLAWAYVIAAVAVAALLWFGRHRLGRGPLAGALLFAVTLSPVLGFVDYAGMRISFVADRYAYLAGIGVISVLVGAAACGATRLRNPGRIAASAVLVAVLAVFGKLSWEHAQVYRDRITFYEHIVSFYPGAQSMQRNLAVALNDARRPTEALAASRLELKRSPDSPWAHNTHGITLLKLNRLDEAEKSFIRALELDSSHKNALFNLADTLRRQERFVESIRWYRERLDADPEFAQAHAGLGAVLFHLRQYAAAVRSLERAVDLRPDAVTVPTLHFLAETLRKLQRNEEAIERYRDVLRIDPGFAYAQAGIGYALFDLKRYQESLEWLARSVSDEPEAPAAADRYSMMGQASEALGRVDAAAKHYARALGLDPGNGGALDSLALLRFRQQRYEEALGLYQSLIEIDDANAQAHVNMGLALHYLERPEEARRSIQRAVTLDPTLLETGLEGLPNTPQQGHR